MGDREIQRGSWIGSQNSRALTLLIISVTTCLVGHRNKWTPKTQPTFLLANQRIWLGLLFWVAARKWWAVFFLLIREMMGLLWWRLQIPQQMKRMAGMVAPYVHTSLRRSWFVPADVAASWSSIVIASKATSRITIIKWNWTNMRSPRLSTCVR